MRGMSLMIRKPNLSEHFLLWVPLCTHTCFHESGAVDANLHWHLSIDRSRDKCHLSMKAGTQDHREICDMHNILYV